MKQGSTLFLKIALFLIGAPIVLLCVWGLPLIAKEAIESSWKFAYIIYGILLVMYISAIPFFTALYQAYKLLSYIDKNNAFSGKSVKALKKIKFCAIAISCLYTLGLPLLYVIAELDDAPGIIVIGLVIVFASSVVAVFAAVLQRLLKEAIDIKLENDLTV